MLVRRIFASLLSLALLGLMPTAAHAVEQKPVDLWVTQTDTPDPVTENHLVTYKISVGNKVPQPANRIHVDLTLTAGSYVSASGHSWSCSVSGLEGNCDRKGALPALTDAGPITVIVRAPSGETGHIENFAVVSTTDTTYFEVDPTNNSWAETTTINRTTATGYVPPTGGSVTTCGSTSPSVNDTTCATVALPPGGPGGTVKLIEGAHITICVTAGCAGGSSVDVIIPDDYDQGVTDAVVVEIFIDSASISSVENDSNRPIYVQKEAGLQAVSIPDCKYRVPGLPCIWSQTRTGSTAASGPGDYIGTIEMYSGDPIFDVGDTPNKVT